MYPKVIFFILFPLFAFSQAPQKINFQSILRNTNGEVVANKSVSLKISILSGSISGSSVYSEIHTKTTDISGLISLQIGNGTILSGVFANIAWGSVAHFIKLEADFSGGSNYVLLGTQELMSVPYALYASKTDTSSLNLVNRFNSKVNVSDTSNMLLNYRTGLNNKVNISDTSNMLNPYLRKSDSIIADLQLQIKQLQSLSNVIDIDGNSYKTVKIGSQIWMSENLKTSRYRNGGPIPNVIGNANWQALTTGAWSYYFHDAANNAVYGKLYNWYTTLGDTLCPTGWHIPTLSDVNLLKSTLNNVALNESGFNANLGGFRYESGNYDGLGGVGFYWISEANGSNVWMFYITSSDNQLGIGDNSPMKGMSVRCLKD